jgi:predicted DNA-binding protein with PD1-like motif
MRLHAVRLREGDDLKGAIETIVREQNLSSVVILSAVGSLGHVRIRMAGAAPDIQDIRDYEGRFEIVSLIGNLGRSRTHLHISFSDEEGRVIGGHLKEGAIVHTTVELVIAIDDKLVFTEEVDATTGFGELKINEQ